MWLFLVSLMFPIGVLNDSSRCRIGFLYVSKLLLWVASWFPICVIYDSSRFPIGLLSFCYRVALGVLYMFSTRLLYDSSRFPLRVLFVAYMVALRFFSVSPMYFYTIPLGFLYASYRFSNGLL